MGNFCVPRIADEKVPTPIHPLNWHCASLGDFPECRMIHPDLSRFEDLFNLCCSNYIRENHDYPDTAFVHPECKRLLVMNMPHIALEMQRSDTYRRIFIYRGIRILESCDLKEWQVILTKVNWRD